MPECFLCYLPEKDSPEVGDLPTLSAGHITFGSFNNFSKVSPEVISLWIAILKAIPDSHLLMKAESLSDSTVRQSFLETFIQGGIAADRIELFSQIPSKSEHLSLYNKIDIAFDTFPYNGTTTTCEAMWMGVPVITLSGYTHASRVGASLLSNTGIPEFIAKTTDEYVEIAMRLSNNVEKLRLLRTKLRDMMVHSPLTDAKRFTGNLENIYRKMWDKWISTKK